MGTACARSYADTVQVWVATVSKHGPLAADFDDWLRSNAAAWIPYGVDSGRTDSWTSASGRVHLHSWDNGQDLVDQTIARSDTTSATTSSGFAHDAGTLLTNAELHRRLGSATDPAAAVWALGGIHAVCRCDEGDVVRAWSSRGRLEPVFFGETDDVGVASNRPLAAHLVARRRVDVDYDPAFAVNVLASGLPVGSGSPYRGVVQLPDMAELVLDGRGPSGRVLADERQVEPRVDYVEPLLGALVDSIAFLGGTEGPVQLSLTGGKDSRLVAALLARAGVDFTTSTIGFPDHPDVVIAADVAALLGVDHRVVPPAGRHGLQEVDLGRRMHDILRSSDGMLVPYDSPSARVSGPASRGATLGGAGGEVLRGGLANVLDPTAEQLTNRITWQLLQHEQRLTAEAVGAQRELLDDWLERNRDVSPGHALGWYHRETRLGRWNMAGRLTQSGRPIIQPFLDSVVIRRSLDAPLDDRSSERAFFAVLRELDERLAGLPLATSSWRFDPPRPARTPPYSWRTRLSGPVGSALAELVLDSPRADEVFELVDRRRFEEFVGRIRTGSVDGKEGPARFLWAVASIATLWSDSWRDDANIAVGPVVDISPPRPGDDTEDATSTPPAGKEGGTAPTQNGPTPGKVGVVRRFARAGRRQLAAQRSRLRDSP